MEIAPGVELITVGESEYMDGFTHTPNVYFVQGSQGVAFVDTAFGKDEEQQAYLELWKSRGSPRVKAIILTHRHGDHIGGAVRLHESTGGPIHAGRVEVEAIDAELKGAGVSVPVGDGATLDLGGATLEFIHTPGHTLGSTCILLREQGVLFTGDMILGSSTTVISPDHGDMADYIESMRKLLPYDARLIAPGHGPMVHNPEAKIKELIDHRLEREEQIVALLRDGNSTIDEMFSAIYPALHAGLHNTAKSQIRAHLNKLEKDGRVERSDGGDYALR
ncbi:MAG: MBL fold metallo-hydrolase [Chloroflexi bacterium]|nr:MBL fold metallo-hydrolase [Chloroflexota bacterium]